MQCDQIGRFLKVRGDQYSQKVAQVFGHYFGYYDKLWISRKTALGTFGQLLKIGMTFYLNIWSR